MTSLVRRRRGGGRGGLDYGWLRRERGGRGLEIQKFHPHQKYVLIFTVI